jgi:hypothetical protein
MWKRDRALGLRITIKGLFGILHHIMAGVLVSLLALEKGQHLAGEHFDHS